MKPRLKAVDVVVPAHNEEVLIGACLRALAAAANNLSLPVRVLVVLDDCSDGTTRVCGERGVPVLRISERNVGAARAAGFAHLAVSRFTRPDAQSVWLATTDADTRVAPNWLVEQVALADDGADAVLGVVDVDDWDQRNHRVRGQFLSEHADTQTGSPLPHGHVHGACLGLRQSTYEDIGGMPPLPLGEDVALFTRLELRPGVRIARSTAVRATTSARRVSRVIGGFATYLNDLEPGSVLAADAP